MKPTILETIFAAKKNRVNARRTIADVDALIARARSIRSAAKPFRLRAALSRNGTNIIAEIKRASPSKGIISQSFDVAETSRAYETGGARAISVLTEEDHFHGSFEDLETVRKNVSLPVLQKDFVFNEFQVYEAAAAGADAILLIVAMLDDSNLKTLVSLADSLGLDVLVETHNAREMERAASIGAAIIGVNNRNLHTFDVSLDTSRELSHLAPANTILVAESGLKTYDDIMDLKNYGYSGFLIGETLMTSGKATEELRRLTGND